MQHLVSFWNVTGQTLPKDKLIFLTSLFVKPVVSPEVSIAMMVTETMLNFELLPYVQLSHGLFGLCVQDKIYKTSHSWKRPLSSTVDVKNQSQKTSFIGSEVFILRTSTVAGSKIELKQATTIADASTVLKGEENDKKTDSSWYKEELVTFRFALRWTRINGKPINGKPILRYILYSTILER